MNPKENEDKIKAQYIEAEVLSMLKLEEYFPQRNKSQIEAQLKEQFCNFQAIIERQSLQNTQVQRQANLLIKDKCYQSLLNIPQIKEQVGTMKYEKRQEEKNSVFQSQQWQDIQSQLVAEYKLRSIEQFTSQDKAQDLARHCDFIKQNGFKSADCKQILSKISKNIVIAKLFFDEMKQKAQKMGIWAKWHKQFQQQFSLLEESYQNELTQLQNIVPKQLHSFLTTFVNIKLFPASSYILQRLKKSPKLAILIHKEAKVEKVQKDLESFQAKEQKKQFFDRNIKIQEQQQQYPSYNCKQES